MILVACYKSLLCLCKGTRLYVIVFL
uniref:Uncharacterized protein n=1 Tax=Rhizophora mucronata TaxID=61149 RepID=A0A2P2NPV6_RHIMU